MSRLACYVAITSLVSSILTPLMAAELAAPRERQAWFDRHLDEASGLYRALHEHPEISLEEAWTSAQLVGRWKSFGMEVTTGVGGHGIVGLLRNGNGPTVMLRTDLDALPVNEQTGLSISSKIAGVMHACGHDMHMTNVTMVAKYLTAVRREWSGTLMVVGQPAEERGLGAMAMIRDGLFERFPKPDYAIALHVDSSAPPGKVKIAGGFVSANSDSVDIIVKGRGGHGSAPHTTIDPVVQAADLIMSLQTIVSREVDPTSAAVVTVGSIVAGTKHNIIGDQCHLQLTVRSHNEEVRAQLIAAIRQRAEGIAKAYGAPPTEVHVSEGVPSVQNDEILASRLRSLFGGIVGTENVLESKRTMGFEDFSHYSRMGTPILLYGLGSVSQARLDRFKELGGPPSLHSATYYPDFEPTLQTGFMTMSAAALLLLEAE